MNWILFLTMIGSVQFHGIPAQYHVHPPRESWFIHVLRPSMIAILPVPFETWANNRFVLNAEEQLLGSQSADRTDSSQPTWYQDKTLTVIAACGVILFTFFVGILTNRHLALEQLIDEKTSDLQGAYNQNLQYQQQLHQIASELCASEERIQRRIGRDLHDEIGQSLTGIGMMLQSLQTHLNDQGTNHRQEIECIMNLLSETVLKTRDFAKILCPVSLDQHGLIGGLQDLAYDLQHWYSIATEFHYDPSVAIIDANTATHIYRITQEATNNAIKHGQATKIVISIREDAEGCVLAIRDNGLGISKDIEQSTGLGLRSMHYRAEMLGGVLTVKPHTEGGTLVTCRFPKSADGNRSESTSVNVDKVKIHDKM